MNCKKCHKLSINVVGKHADGRAYKYTCKKNTFPALSAIHTLGKSYYYNGTEHYTKNQIDNYILIRKNSLCFAKYNLTNSNIISGFALIVSIIALTSNFSAKDSKATILQEEPQTRDSSLLQRIKMLEDSLEVRVHDLETQLLNKKN